MEMWHAGERQEHKRDIQKQETAWYMWKDIIKINLKEILREGVKWINLAEEKDQQQVTVSAIIRGRTSYNTENFLNI